MARGGYVRAGERHTWTGPCCRRGVTGLGSRVLGSRAAAVASAIGFGDRLIIATTPLWAAAAAAALMVALRCAPAVLPLAPAARHARLLVSASRAAVVLALAQALYRLLRLDGADLAAGLVFAASGLAVFLALRTLAGAIVGAASAYGAYLWLLDIIGGRARFHPPHPARINRLQGGARAHIIRLHARALGSALDIERACSRSVTVDRL